MKTILIILGIALVLGVGAYFGYQQAVKITIRKILSYQGKESKKNPGQFIEINTTQTELEKLSLGELKDKLKRLEEM